MAVYDSVRLFRTKSERSPRLRPDPPTAVSHRTSHRPLQAISRPSSNCREGRRAHRKNPWLTRAICRLIDWAVRLDGVRRGLCGRRAEERRAIASIGVRVGGKKVGQRRPSVSRAASCRRIARGLGKAAGSRSERKEAKFEQQQRLQRM